MSEEKRTRILVESNMQERENWRRDWVVICEPDVTEEEYKNPIFWSHVAPKFTEYDRIEIRPESGEWIAELVVTEVSRSWAKVFQIQRYELTGVTTKKFDRGEFDVSWGGPHQRWRVIRRADNQIMTQQLPNRRAAESWVDNYENAL